MLTLPGLPARGSGLQGGAAWPGGPGGHFSLDTRNPGRRGDEAVRGSGHWASSRGGHIRMEGLVGSSEVAPRTPSQPVAIALSPPSPSPHTLSSFLPQVVGLARSPIWVQRASLGRADQWPYSRCSGPTQPLAAPWTPAPSTGWGGDPAAAWCIFWAFCFDGYLASLREGYRVRGRQPAQPARPGEQGLRGPGSQPP